MPARRSHQSPGPAPVKARVPEEDGDVDGAGRLLVCEGVLGGLLGGGEEVGGTELLEPGLVETLAVVVVVGETVVVVVGETVVVVVGETVVVVVGGTVVVVVVGGCCSLSKERSTATSSPASSA